MKLKALKKFAAATWIVGAASLGLVHAAEAQEKLRIEFVTHANDADSWWTTIKSGIREAARQMDVEVKWSNPPNGDLSEMARLIDQAVASKPDGLITAIPDINVLGKSISTATRKGIPVIIFNSGTPEQVKEVGAKLRIGWADYEAGKAAGERAKAAGAKDYVCVNHDIGNFPVGERCRGYADGIGVPLEGRMIDVGMDPETVRSRVTAYLKTHPDTDALLATGPNGAHPTIQVLEQLRLAGKVHFGAFDLSPQIVEAIQKGTMQYALDQQPYLQSYLSIVFMANYLRYGVIVPDNIASGPAFVTKENADLVAKLAGEYR